MSCLSNRTPQTPRHRRLLRAETGLSTTSSTRQLGHLLSDKSLQGEKIRSPVSLSKCKTVFSQQTPCTSLTSPRPRPPVPPGKGCPGPGLTLRAGHLAPSCLPGIPVLWGDHFAVTGSGPIERRRRERRTSKTLAATGSDSLRFESSPRPQPASSCSSPSTPHLRFPRGVHRSRAHHGSSTVMNLFNLH